MFNIRENRTLRRLDWPLALAVIGILIVGLITIASANACKYAQRRPLLVSAKTGHVCSGRPHLGIHDSEFF